MTKVTQLLSKSSLAIPSDGTLETALTDDSWRSDLESGDSYTSEPSEGETDAFLVRDPETTTLAGSLLVPNFSTGRYSVPLQSHSK